MNKRLRSLKLYSTICFIALVSLSGCKKDHLELTPLNQNVGSEAGSVILTISSSTSWTISDDADWLTLEPESGSGDGTITATYSENILYTSRVAIITANAPDAEASVASITQGDGGPQIDISWTQKADIPTPRGFLPPSSPVLDGKAYIIGGINTPATLYGIVEVYDPITNTWETKASLNTPRWGHSADVVDGKIYVMGGCPDLMGDATRSIEIYDPATDSWSDGGQMPDAVLGFASCVVNNRIYVIGGRNNEPEGDYLTDVKEYDPFTQTWTSLTSLPWPRGYLSVSAVGDYIYAVGGVTNGTGGGGESTVFKYYIAGNIWTEENSLTYGRWGIMSCTVDNMIYCIGGYTLPTDAGQKLVEVINTDHDITSGSTGLQYQRAAGTVCVIDGKIYTFSGYNTSPPSYVAISETEEGVITIN